MLAGYYVHEHFLLSMLDVKVLMDVYAYANMLLDVPDDIFWNNGYTPYV